jgi:prepilin-type N-terminal cleavage/methylation domain-containing protein
MPICRLPRDAGRRQRRRGLTLTELLAASVIMAMIAGSLSTLAMAVQGASGYCRGQATAAQHGRVVLQRIEQAVYAAHASEQFPGFVVFSDVVGAYDYPDTLVVWQPQGTATDPTGRPRVKELVVFCPNPQNREQLLELRWPANNTTVPLLTSMSSWTSLLTSIKTNATSRVELTNRLRTASTDAYSASNPSQANQRAAIRFNVLMAPSESQWAQYKAGTRPWDELDWPLDVYSTQLGVRSIVCQSELQLQTGDGEGAHASLPFFGSAAITTELHK